MDMSTTTSKCCLASMKDATWLHFLTQSSLQYTLSDRNSPLHEIIAKNLSDVFELAVNVDEENLIKYSKNAMICLSTKSALISHAAMHTALIIQRINSFLSEPISYTEEKIGKFYDAVIKLCENTNYKLLFLLLPRVFSKWVSRLDSFSVYTFMGVLTECHYDGVHHFLMKQNAVDALFEALKTDEKNTLRLLRILLNIANADIYDFTCKNPYIEENRIVHLCKLVLSNNNQISSVSSKIMHVIVDYFCFSDPSDRDGTSTYSILVENLSKYVSSFVDFIKAGPLFTEAKFQVIEVIKSLSNGLIRLNDEISDLTNYLYQEMLQYPTNPFIQVSFVALFEKMSKDQNRLLLFNEQNNIAKSVIEKLSDYKNTYCSFTSVYLKMAEIINQKIPKETIGEDWELFWTDVVTNMKNDMESPLGGSLNLQGYDDEYEEEDMFEEDREHDEWYFFDDRTIHPLEVYDIEITLYSDEEEEEYDMQDDSIDFSFVCSR